MGEDPLPDRPLGYQSESLNYMVAGGRGERLLPFSSKRLFEEPGLESLDLQCSEI